MPGGCFHLCLPVHLFVDSMGQKVMNGFRGNFWEGLAVVQGTVGRCSTEVLECLEGSQNRAAGHQHALLQLLHAIALPPTSDSGTEGTSILQLGVPKSQALLVDVDEMLRKDTVEIVHDQCLLSTVSYSR